MYLIVSYGKICCQRIYGEELAHMAFSRTFSIIFLHFMRHNNAPFGYLFKKLPLNLYKTYKILYYISNYKLPWGVMYETEI